MKILLIGEYSGFHNSLKAGLVKLGHEVTIAGIGDHFKKFPVDIDLESTSFRGRFGNYLRQGIYKISKFDIASFETAFLFNKNLDKLKDFDVVQLVNEYPLKTDRKIEYFLLKYIFKHNKNVYLSACGDDFHYISFLMKEVLPYSVLSPFFKNKKLKNSFKYSLGYLSKENKKIHELVFKNIKGIICGDMDYKIAYDNLKIETILIPFPVNVDKFEISKIEKLEAPIVIFHGINRVNYFKKGNDYFEAALKIIEQKYGERVKIIVAESLPYSDYIKSYKTAHILLDTVYGYDQGYNALEAMAQGKAVFSGAEEDFLKFYNLKKDKVCINALPDVPYLVEKLSWLIENPQKIEEIGQNAQEFIQTQHYYVKSAEKYLQAWGKN